MHLKMTIYTYNYIVSEDKEVQGQGKSFEAIHNEKNLVLICFDAPNGTCLISFYVSSALVACCPAVGREAVAVLAA